MLFLLHKCIKCCISSLFDVLWSSSSASPLFSIAQRDELKLSKIIVVVDDDDDNSTREATRNNFWNKIFTCSGQDATKIELTVQHTKCTHAQTQTEAENKNRRKNRSTNFINTLPLKHTHSHQMHACIDNKLERTQFNFNQMKICVAI